VISIWIILAVLVGLILRLIAIQTALTGSEANFFANPAYQANVLLENFPVYKQVYANSCGPTTISMIYSYLVNPISEQGLADQLNFPLGKSGMLPTQFFDKLQSALGKSGYHVEYQVNIPDADFLGHVYTQLQHGIPVPIYFSTVNAWDRPNYDTHYSAIIGMRPQQRMVVIANAYGFLEEMPVDDLLLAIKYNNYRDAPIDFRLGLFAGVINKNNLYIIQK
jgi:hypothetical protein